MIKGVALILLISMTAKAELDVIELYTNCKSDSVECKEIEYKYTTLKLAPEPALVFNKENIVDVYKTPNEWGIMNLYFSLNKEAAATLKRVSRENIDKPLHIVFNGELISSPTVSGEISDGFLLSNGAKEDFTILDEVDWLQELLDTKASENTKTRRGNLVWIVLITLFLLSGVLLYAFKKSDS